MSAAPDPASSEYSVPLSVGRVLLGGLLVSVLVMLAGLLDAALRGKSVTHVLPLQRMVRALAAGDPAALLDGGILLLFATPLFGVFAALAGFLRVRDRVFALVSAALLVMLAASFAVALR